MCRIEWDIDIIMPYDEPLHILEIPDQSMLTNGVALHTALQFSKLVIKKCKERFFWNSNADMSSKITRSHLFGISNGCVP